MKNKLLAALAAFGLVASASAVKINDNLSINGFLDGSYKMVDNDGAVADSQSLRADEAEINFVVSNGAVSGLIAIDSSDVSGNDQLNIEQAHFSYDLGNGLSVTAGRYGSALGFEREDPAGLYTYSRAYSNARFNLGDADNTVNEGVSVAYSADAFSIAASLQEKRTNAVSGAAVNLENDDLDLEVSFSYTGFADTVIGGGYSFANEAASANEVDTLNIHASRSFGKFLVAGEYIESQQDSGDLDAYMVLVDYDYNDKIGAAIRFSNNETGANTEYDKLTIAPNYQISDNLGAILEFSDIDNAGAKSEEIALEVTYTF